MLKTAFKAVRTGLQMLRSRSIRCKTPRNRTGCPTSWLFMGQPPVPPVASASSCASSALSSKISASFQALHPRQPSQNDSKFTQNDSKRPERGRPSTSFPFFSYDLSTIPFLGLAGHLHRPAALGALGAPWPCGQLPALEAAVEPLQRFLQGLRGLEELVVAKALALLATESEGREALGRSRRSRRSRHYRPYRP